MKRFLAAVAFVVVGVFVSIPVLAQSRDEWEITSFHADIVVSADGSMDVKETIITDFHVDKHGIYRDIPVKYRNSYNQHISLGLEVLGVTDAVGNPVTYDVSRDGSYEHIKIGDADRTITGKQIYVIEYKVDRALRYFDDHDELYWNVTGTEWEVPIQESSATIDLPFPTTKQMNTICYTGLNGSTEQACTGRLQLNQAVFAANDFLTVAVSWPKGLVTEPSFGKKVGWFLGDNFGVFLPFAALALGYWVWSKRGRDPQGHGIVRQYEAPDKASPAEVAYLVNQRFSANDISAEIVSLAEQGFLTIKEIKKDGWIKDTFDYELSFIKDASQAQGHQRSILETLRAEATNNKLLISDLPTDFYKSVETIKNAVWSSVHARGYFDQKPETAVVMWVLAAIGIGMIMFFLAVSFSMRIDLVIGGIIAEVILLVFAFLMPKRTEKGVAAYQYAQGFKQYITAAETERVKWEETQNLFFAVLPYAMVFGIADKWAKAFEGKLNQQPQWYTGTPGRSFSPVYFTHSMNAFSAATVSHTSPPSSNSSGFSGGSSGGGGGGGGGGSW